MNRHALLLLLTGLLPVTALAETERYRLDPVHTRVLFSVEHAGFSQALGTISGSEGRLDFDADDWSSAQLDVSVPIDRSDLGDPAWNEATLARNLLDAKQHPQARFVSTRVEPIDATHANVTGQLTLRGVTREVTLAVTLNALKRHPMPPFRRTAGFSATTMIRRADFGITAWPSMIGDQVQIRIEAEAIRDSNAQPPAPPQLPDGAAPAAPPLVEPASAPTPPPLRGTPPGPEPRP